MTTEEAIKFAEYAQRMTDFPDVKEFYRLAEAALRAQQERENHKPLTLDELREMDLGSPPIWDRNLNEWCAVRRSVNGFAVIVYIGGGSRPLEANRFYRHKPKEDRA